MAKPRKDSGESHLRRPPATTPEARENQMVALAVDQAEKQIREGTASSQILIHYLKIGGTRERIEKQKLESENELLRAKVESLASQSRVEELYQAALAAMTSYSGEGEEDPYED